MAKIKNDILGRMAHSDSKPVHLLLSQTQDFLERLKRHRHKEILTDQMIIDINAERRRITLLEITLKTIYTFYVSNIEISDDDARLLRNFQQIHYKWKCC